jgi:NAD(P)-dependent dehydrogenase (short-subunit alcohol dehydrogenase family)
VSRHEPEPPESETAATSTSPAGSSTAPGSQYRWPGLTDHAAARPAGPVDGFDLPPLPTLRPLSIFRPFSAMAPQSASTAPDPGGRADPIRIHADPAEVGTAPAGNAGVRVPPQPPATIPSPAPPRAGPRSAEPVRAASVLVIGGTTAHRATLTRRLAGAGMRVLLQSPDEADEDPALVGVEGDGHRSVPGDRADTEAVIRMVSDAIDTDDHLTGLVILPGPHRPPVALSDPTDQVADGLADALSTEVLGPAAAIHAAVRRWTAGKRIGRIVVVADEPDRSGPARGGGASWPGALSAAALTVLADHLTSAAAGSGVGIAVVGVAPTAPTRPGSAGRDLSRLADGVVLALGPLVGRPGLDPVDGSVLRLTL